MRNEFESSYEDGRKNIFNNLVEQYFMSGNVDKVIFDNPYCGISWAELHRELDRRGIEKLKGGPRTSVKHALFFMNEILERKLPVQNVYYQHMQPSFKEHVSVAAVHRYAQYVKRQFDGNIDSEKKAKHRAYGTALCIYHPDDPKLVLIARDVSAPNDRFGKKFGSVTLPMGYTNKGKPKSGIIRVFQQEVSTPLALKGELGRESDTAKELLEDISMPILRLDIANVRVSLYALAMPRSLTSLDEEVSSNKLIEHSWIDIDTLAGQDPNNRDIRGGVVEMSRAYVNHLEEKRIYAEPKQCTLNFKLAEYLLDTKLDESCLVGV